MLCMCCMRLMGGGKLKISSIPPLTLHILLCCKFGDERTVDRYVSVRRAECWFIVENPLGRSLSSLVLLWRVLNSQCV